MADQDVDMPDVGGSSSKPKPSGSKVAKAGPADVDGKKRFEVKKVLLWPLFLLFSFFDIVLGRD